MSRRQWRRCPEAQHVDVQDAVRKAADHAQGGLDRERGLAGTADRRDYSAGFPTAQGGDLGLAAGKVGDAAGYRAQGRRRGLGLRSVPQLAPAVQ